MEYPSTNVSSPVRAPKQKIQSYAYQPDEDEDEDYFEAPRHPARKTKTAGKFSDDAIHREFAPVRVAKSVKSSNMQALGNPITSDDRLADLTEHQHDILLAFVNEAKAIRQDIMSNRGHRQPIFSDTILREFGLELPRSLDEMRLIPGVRAEMVDQYGKRFMSLINNTRSCYGADPPSRKYLPKTRHRRTKPVVDEDDDAGEVVEDPNREICEVIDLCVSDTENVPVESETETDYSVDGDEYEDEEADDGVHTSHHFTQHLDSDVEAFNHRMSQLGPMVPKSTAASRAPASRSKSKAPFAKKGQFSRRSGSMGQAGRSSSGVKKRTAKGGGSRASAGPSVARKASSGRKGTSTKRQDTLTTGRIGAMPT